MNWVFYTPDSFTKLTIPITDDMWETATKYSRGSARSDIHVAAYSLMTITLHKLLMNSLYLDENEYTIHVSGDLTVNQLIFDIKFHSEQAYTMAKMAYQ